MKKYTFLFFLGLVASLFTACSDDDNLTDSITPAPESENFFANGMTFASQPGVRRALPILSVDERHGC